MIHARPLLATNSIYLSWLSRRLSVIFTFSLLISIFIIVKLFNNQHEVNLDVKIPIRSELLLDDARNTIDDSKIRIKDLEKIRLSLRNELRIIGIEKYKLLDENISLRAKNEKLISQINKGKTQLRQLDLDVQSQRKRNSERDCDTPRIPPILFTPLEPQSILDFSYRDTHELVKTRRSWVPSGSSHNYSGYSFDYSFCSLAKGFSFYVPPPEPLNDTYQNFITDPNVVNEILINHDQYTVDAEKACLVIMIPGFSSSNQSYYIDKNVMILNLSIPGSIFNEDRRVKQSIASPIFSQSFNFIEEFDLLLPKIWNQPSSYNSLVESIPPQSPTNRKYLAAYFGHSDRTSGHDSYFEEILRTIHRNSIDDLFMFLFSCQNDFKECLDSHQSSLESSTFLIILPDYDTNSHIYLLQLSLLRGSIPVIVNSGRTRLPFDEVIDWRRAALILNLARLPEMHFILRTYSPADIYQLKYHGRRVFEKYLATSKQIVDTTLSFMSMNRFGFPPSAIRDIPTQLYMPHSSLILDTECLAPACQATLNDSSMTIFLSQAEILGPREKPLSSQVFFRNYSLVMNSMYDLWNGPMLNPFELYPSHPLDPILPAEFKFIDQSSGFRPMAEGSGAEFSHDIGGDYPNEQFTIILLTYERQSILMKTLERLKGLPYLNKVLVVWNGINRPPAPDLVWPDMGAPIEIVRTKRNSLNNRFIPYDTIQTDAILSLDDDTPLRADEIVFAFRVWRESRDRIVGFPGRFNAWDTVQNSWLYNSNHSCQLSMVLTGGAFFHRYYLYQYSYHMPESIRLIVDKLMNCEDIAMNFLVAHLTRKPPIKVTSRWTFHCASCQSSLSQEESHFRERHECLNSFASIYGYMPLLNTQHRSDSVLFKTRLPRDKQKCFKYV